MSSIAATGPKRFYTSVAVAAQGDSHGVILDGRAAKTPNGAPLQAPTGALAQLLAEEWEAQGATIALAAMPLTRLAFTSIDRTPGERGSVAAGVARHVRHDLLCHVAEGPARLIALQEDAWAPWRAWAQSSLGVDLSPVSGLLSAGQSPEAVHAAAALAAMENDFALTGLAAAAALLGSGVLAFALRRGAADADTVFEASRVEEAFQETVWGVDAEAAARARMLRLEAQRLEAWFRAL